VNNEHLPSCYWVIPGSFLAGEYPASPYFDEHTRSLLRGLLDAGVNLVLDLTEVDELPPYSNVLQEQADWLKVNVEHHRMSIRDFSVPAEQKLREILDFLDDALLKEKVVYVHCYGGIGRTGTVVGCYLVRHGMGGEQALEEIQRLRQGIDRVWMRSPETDAQREMVLNWKNTDISI
jgi:protein-tyrosine phosphatase